MREYSNANYAQHLQLKSKIRENARSRDKLIDVPDRAIQPQPEMEKDI